MDEEDENTQRRINDMESRLLSEYQNLVSRHVDLVGDYAGGELFLIDGDSLLLRCFSDDLLDFDDGFQLLHAVYNVESFLQHLNQRKCHFHIVFFDCNSKLSRPSRTAQRNISKYRLARAVIVRHLSAHLPPTNPGIEIHRFQSWTSPSFLQYLRDTKPYFLMVHDGAQQDRNEGNTSSSSSSSSPSSRSSSVQEKRLLLRYMILCLISEGFNIALINELYWRDTKVITTVLEPNWRKPLLKHFAKLDISGVSLDALDVTHHVTQLAHLLGTITERQLLAIVVVSIVRREIPHGTSQGDWSRYCVNFLVHEALISHLSLSSRASLRVKPSPCVHEFIHSVAMCATRVLSHRSWPGEDGSRNRNCDIADFIDGRLFRQVSQNEIALSDPEAKRTLRLLLEAVEIVTGCRLEVVLERNLDQSFALGESEKRQQETVDQLAYRILPFSNHVFNKHLEDVQIHATSVESAEQRVKIHKKFKDQTHWHNAQKPLTTKLQHPPTDSWQAKKLAARNQRQMADMQKYAASLTNAVGKSLEPEIIVSRFGNHAVSGSRKVAIKPDAASTGQKIAQKQPGSAKTNAKNAHKKVVTLNREAEEATKNASNRQKLFTNWQSVRENIDAHNEPETRYWRVQMYYESLPESSQKVIGCECKLYMAGCLAICWQKAIREKNQPRSYHLRARIWHQLASISDLESVPAGTSQQVLALGERLALPPFQHNFTIIPGRKLSFLPVTPSTIETLTLMHPKVFQLLHCGPYLERSFDSTFDARVNFHPDAWQRDVLNSIDANRSIFVVAPTSAGKTFISFYAMRKVLEADDDGVLVYVAPTKALVNQIAAEVQARYSKSFKHGGKSVWAIHTRDHRVNNPSGCQILVTVPHILQIMLMSPWLASTWSTRVRRIVFDEIHSIGQAEDGVVWEQLLLMAPCPIIALSATVGNPGEFSEWLESTQQSIGVHLDTIIHPYRYSDLRKFYYNPTNTYVFTGLPDKKLLSDASLDGLTGIEYIHPMAALLDKSRGIPEDLSLEPRDCFYLWEAMKALDNPEFPIPEQLNPIQALPEKIRKSDVLVWEKDLKTLLNKWLNNPESPYEDVIDRLAQGHSSQGHREESGNDMKPNMQEAQSQVGDDVLQTTLALLCQLHERDALPVIIFNYDRRRCEKICKTLLNQLVDAENAQVKSKPGWSAKLQKWDEWKTQKADMEARSRKEEQKRTKARSKNSSTDNDDQFSRLERQRDGASTEHTKWDLFDPDRPLDGYHFADLTKLPESDLTDYLVRLRMLMIDPVLLDALRRGIGVHHAGMNKKYRQVVEMLFRRRFLRVVIATGTLALGINMPCKTVVFSGDSIFLTALNFRQCSGRAGRRGFDLLGNVVFHGISKQKVHRLISSRLPSLNGHFPITTSFVLRLFTLLCLSQYSDYAVTAVNSVLSQPRLYLGGQSFKDQTMHHLRFSIEYLRRQDLLDAKGNPLNFAGLISHLYYTENSSFAFHALLKDGYFTRLCTDIKSDEDAVLMELMLVMSHLFNRVACKQSDTESGSTMKGNLSSIVFLPPLPLVASDILARHDRDTQAVFEAYVHTYIQQHQLPQDNMLPLTKTKYGSEEPELDKSALCSEHARIRSAFVALSGAEDVFTSIHDLCSTVRSGVFLEEAVIPYIQVASKANDKGPPINAYLLDFFKHGDVVALERDNGIRRSDVWFYLNDFSLVLATIVTSFETFLGIGSTDDVDMLDVQGEGDVLTNNLEDELDLAAMAQEKITIGSNTSGDAKGDNFRSGSNSTTSKRGAGKKKEAVVDSWEDDDDNDMEGASAGKTDSRRPSQTKSTAGYKQSTTTNTSSTYATSSKTSDDFEAIQGDGLRDVLRAFVRLKERFNEKFKAMWA